VTANKAIWAKVHIKLEKTKIMGIEPNLFGKFSEGFLDYYQITNRSLFRRGETGCLLMFVGLCIVMLSLSFSFFSLSVVGMLPCKHLLKN
jgi:hypothetical protein